MGSWSSSCGEVCWVFLFRLPHPVPFYSWRLKDFCSSSCVCLIPSLFPWGYFQPKEGDGSVGTASVDPFKKTFQASTVCRVFGAEFSFPSTEVALWQGETCLEMFSTFNLIHLIHSSWLLFHRKAEKPHTGCFNLWFVCSWGFTAVPSMD